jgi:hypothetical protein
LVELYFILRNLEFSWMPFALYVQNKKIKTVFIFERAPLNLERAIKSRERERKKEKGFGGGRPIGRPETNSGSGQIRKFNIFGQLEAAHSVKWTWQFGHEELVTKDCKLEHRGDQRVIWTSQIGEVNLAKIV